MTGRRLYTPSGAGCGMPSSAHLTRARTASAAGARRHEALVLAPVTRPVRPVGRDADPSADVAFPELRRHGDLDHPLRVVAGTDVGRRILRREDAIPARV